MGEKLERSLNILLTASAVAIAGAFVYRSVGPDRANAGTERTGSSPTYVANWQELVPAGIPLSPSGREITIVEFSDYECPFCSMFDSVAREVAADPRYSRRVSHLFLHSPFPGTRHKFALPAARAAECAARQNRFAEMHHLIFKNQDSLGLKRWNAFAVGAGVRDTLEFMRCQTDTRPMPRIETSRALASQFKVAGTPTVFVNGWRYNRVMTTEELSAAIDSLLVGRKPAVRPATTPRSATGQP